MLSYYYFLVHGSETPLGYPHKSFVHAMDWPDGWKVDHEKRTLTLMATSFKQRTTVMEETLKLAAEKGSVEGLKRWANEAFPIYAGNGEHLLDLDGVGVGFFGIVNYSVHMIGWVKGSSGEVKYWVPRRALTKMSFPGMLDNTVGGSLSSGERAVDCIVREAEEEISIDPAYTRANVRPCGTASYQMTQTDHGDVGCQLQVQYLYEMEFDQSIVPKIGDGEVSEIQLKTLDEVREALAKGEFKLNCAMTWLSFLIRHGHLNAENEPDLNQICARLNRKHDLFII